MRPDDPSYSPQPVFIVASPRSATSILTWCLGQHPNIKSLDETYWIAALSIGALIAYRIGSSRGPKSALSAFQVPEGDFFERLGDTIDCLIDDYFEARVARIRTVLRHQDRADTAPLALVRAHDEPKARWVDGTPLNTHYIPGLIRLFPDGRFIHVLRNPIDVIKSLVKFDRAGGKPRAPERACREWMNHIRHCLLAEQAFGPERILRIPFESIQDAPRDTIGRCLAFAGEEFAEACLFPLQKRINSSRVGADEEVLTEDFLNSDLVREAMRYYDGARAGRLSLAADAEAARAEMERQFAESWRHVPSFVRGPSSSGVQERAVRRPPSAGGHHVKISDARNERP